MKAKLELKDCEAIRTIEDLKSDKARAIAHQYKLKIEEILPKYLELTKEVIANGHQIKIDMDDPNTPLNVPEGYCRKLACGAVLSYELVQRDAIQFPVAEQLKVIRGEVFSVTEKLKGTFYRIASVEVYELIGQYYEKVIESLNRYQEVNLDRILNESEINRIVPAVIHSDSYSEDKLTQRFKDFQNMNEFLKVLNQGESDASSLKNIGGWSIIPSCVNCLIKNRKAERLEKGMRN